MVLDVDVVPVACVFVACRVTIFSSEAVCTNVINGSSILLS